MGIQDVIAFPGNGGSFHIDDGKGPGSAGSGKPEGGQGIDGLSGLGDDDDQCFFVDEWFLISEFGGNGHGNRNPEKRLQK